MTTARKIKQRIEDMQPGSAFVARDFLDIASIDNANATLRRIAQSGRIFRILQGVYIKPLRYATLGADMLPKPDAVAQAIARSHEWTIVPTGITALNQLGIHRTVHDVLEYVSTGKHATYYYGTYTITLRPCADDYLVNLSERSCLIYQALKSLGKITNDEELAQLISQHLSADDINSFSEEIRDESPWAYKIAQRMKQAENVTAYATCPR